MKPDICTSCLDTNGPIWNTLFSRLLIGKKWGNGYKICPQNELMINALIWIVDFYYLFWWSHQCLKYGQTIIMRSSWFINMSRGTFEKVWMICLGVGAGLKWSHRRALVCKRDEKTSSDCQKKEIPSAWHLNPLFEADKEKRIEVEDQTSS